MADAGRHSDLTFVSSFVSELDVAVRHKSRSNIYPEGVANRRKIKIADSRNR